MSKHRSPNVGLRQNKKKRRLKKPFRYIISFIVVAIICVASYGTYLYIKADSAMTDAYDDDGREKSDLRDEYVDPKFDNVSILLMGVDQNEKRKEREIARTDALVLATLNKDDKSIRLLSIPRDSYVYIPKVGYEDKINHAHAFGGTTGTIETVEQLLDIPVDYYVKVNFRAFVDVIDAIGGIEAEVPYEFTESNSFDKRDSIHLYPGKQVLDGEEALALARTRKMDTDVMRGQRQLDLIKAVIDKSASITSVMKYDDLIDSVGKNMSTNMTFTEMKSFFSYATHGSKLDVERLNLEGQDYQPSGVYYWQLDDQSLYETTLRLKSHLEILTEAEAIDYEYIEQRDKDEAEAEKAKEAEEEPTDQEQMNEEAPLDENMEETY